MTPVTRWQLPSQPPLTENNLRLYWFLNNFKRSQLRKSIFLKMPKKKKQSEWQKNDGVEANDGLSDELDESYKKEDDEDGLDLEKSTGDEDEDNY